MSPHIGIVGLGLMGTAHAERLRDAGATIAGADIDAKARDQFTTQFEAPVFNDYNALIDSGVDAIVITVPNALHEEVAVAALESGVHVLVEKPLAHTVSSAERIMAAARESTAFCIAGFVLRYYTCFEELHARCVDGEFGEIQHVEAAYVRRDGVPERGWFRNPDLAGGGAVVDIGVHVLDLALAILDFPDIDGVYGRTRSERARLDVEDSATGLIRTSEGSTIALETAWAANRKARKEVVVRGSEGGATLDLSDETLTIYDATESEPDVCRPGETEWLTPEDEALVSAVKSRKPPMIGDLEEALAVQRVIESLYESDATGEVVCP
ncbi:Predicted dehydrogenase [Halogranum amylolyticum]|uniref:Predicted dehydrogenase n=1 Tax=Halogranum amylolyticum TaxID=660520 RepID=A0A1H8UHS1_9EURY|nr:Gfo/Idh/MocA family oxidoreductase [Halogranum amylolyticum]SEP02782.1 Predicted dehydrogenase [Halogranum amylolyticum]